MKEYKPMINIPLDILIDVCGNNKKSKEQIKEEFRIMNDEDVHEVFRYRKFNDGFSDSITFYNNGDYVVGVAKPCYTEFLKKICKALSLPERKKYEDDDALTEELRSQIQKLENTKNEEALRKDFNSIYRDLQDGRTYMKEVKKLKDDPSKAEEYRNRDKYFYRCALSRNFDILKPKQVELYKRFTERRHQYKELIENRNYNHFITANFDVYKLALFLAHNYLEFSRRVTNLETLRFVSKVVSNYINSNAPKNMSITLKNGDIVDYNSIIHRDIELKQRIEQMTKVEVEWELIPSGKREDPINESSATRIKMKEQDIEELRRKGRERTDFYENSNYIVKANGTVKFHGYQAYFYKNGNVILDRKYEDRYPSTAIGNAIYYFKARYFELISGMDKTELKKIPMVGHMNHNETWKQRIQEVIDAEGEDEDVKYADDIIDRLKKRSR